MIYFYSLLLSLSYCIIPIVGNKANSFKIEQDDVIKFGRVRFKIKKLVLPAFNMGAVNKNILSKKTTIDDRNREHTSLNTNMNMNPIGDG